MVDVYAASDAIPVSISVADLIDNVGGKKRVWCRGISRAVYAPNKVTYTQYIQEALISTLIDAARYSKNAPHVLRGTVDMVDFNTTTGYWLIRGKFNIDNSVPVYVRGRYAFPSAWGDDEACEKAAQAFDQAVAAFVHDILTNAALTDSIN